MNTPIGRLRRRASLGCLVAASLLLVAATAADPAVGDVEFAKAIAADPDAARLHSLLLHWSWVLFVPGLLGLLAPVTRRGRVLASLAWVAVLVGLTTFAGLTLSDFFGVAVAETTDVATFHRIEEQVGGYGWLTAGWQLPGLLGWALAMLLTPVAAARARRTGWWYPALAVPGFGLYLLFAIEEPPLSLTGPVLLTAANAVVAARLWRADATGAAGSGAEAEAPPGAGFAGFRRGVAVVSLVAAPVALGAGMAALPGGAFHLDDFSADPVAAQASAFFLHLGWLLFIPGVIELTGRVTGRGRVLAQVAGALAVLGLLHLNGLMIGDYGALAAVQVLDGQQLSAVEARTGDDVLLTVGIALPGMLGALLGLILVPLAAVRARLAGWPAALAAGLGVVAFLFLTTGRVPGLVAPALLLVGYGLLARALATGGPAAGGPARSVPTPQVPATAGQPAV